MKIHTQKQLVELKLPAFITVFEEINDNPTHHLSLEEALAMMADRELVMRDNKRLTRLLKASKLRYPSACIADIDYGPHRVFNKEQMRQLTHGEWITKNRNIIFTGPTGTGKSYLACALGQQICQLGHKVRYYRLPRLLETLRLAHADGSYSKILEQLAKIQLLILDDWGLDQLDRVARRDILEILEDRYSKSSTIITSQLPPSNWHHFVGDDTIADAVCDRVLSNAHIIDITGDSMRRTQQQKLDAC